MIEQDRRFIRKLTRPMKGFKSLQFASASLDGIKVVHLVRKH
ncbi:DDE-type integrase/transposase/recombinase [Rhizobium sp. PL01]|nr:DDE-type integrase/transposase/recombinase [Rhizobium sp. PL01]MDW5316758.1 DDE-type integrase/transposase/recombinase [Rhizobium sp. PL01]